MPSSEDELFEDEMELERAAKRTGKGSGSEGHFGARSAWRTKSGGVVFVHDFSCFGGTLELVGRPQDIKAVEKGELLGQQVLWHPPKPRRLSMKEKPEGSTASTEEPPPEPLRGWFDGNTLFWEPKTKLLGGVSEAAREVHSIHEAVGVPMDGELPPGPWRRITSALEPEGVPGPDGGLWRLQMAFYADCHGPLPLEYLEKLGAYQAGPGARELYLRSRRDARPQDTEAAKTEAAEQDEWLEEWQSEEEDYPLEALGLVDVSPKAVAFEDIMPNLQRGSAPRLQTFDS
ncbi:unnamed protein product [Effrenium voratum]|nr:unnamed protein product [Effrenium voratum]